MTMYKPGTQLILTDLWSAAAADRLGFEVKTYHTHMVVPRCVAQKNPNWMWKNRFDSADFCKKWRITVTESGPNAAELVSKLHSDLIEAAAVLGLPKFSEVIEPERKDNNGL